MSTFRVPMSGVFIENRYLALAANTLICTQQIASKILLIKFAGVKLKFDLSRKENMEVPGW